MAEDVESRRVAGDDPAAQRRDVSDRTKGAQPGQCRVRIGLELVEREVVADAQIIPTWGYNGLAANSSADRERAASRTSSGSVKLAFDVAPDCVVVGTVASSTEQMMSATSAISSAWTPTSAATSSSNGCR